LLARCRFRQATPNYNPANPAKLPAGQQKHGRHFPAVTIDMLHNKTNFIARRRVSAAMIYYNIKPSGVLRKTHFSAPSGPFLTLAV
jgi:hypothetical protein